MKSMQYTLDQFTKHLGLPDNPINDELRELIKAGEDVKAVKKARETLGLSLLVEMGPFKSKIYINEIRKIRSIKNPNKSSNLSAHKLEILIGKYDVIKISPNNRSKLIQSLLAINPDIQIDVTSIVSDK